MVKYLTRTKRNQVIRRKQSQWGVKPWEAHCQGIATRGDCTPQTPSSVLNSNWKTTRLEVEPWEAYR
eukprot:1157893-Pelagomonas_calceolata.AAC.5